tara:strand:+ start:1857 stop:2180 length:324 start_codon:yes stop_codon:yes gene_type:complete
MLNSIEIVDGSIVRASDPDTSHIAARKVTATTRQTGVEYMATLVRNYPRLTKGELLQLVMLRGGHTFVQLSSLEKRLYDAASQGLVVATGKRQCSETKHIARVWCVK